MFIAVGWTLIQERRENRAALRLAKQHEQMKRIKQGKIL
jgi:hypothetical protein